MENILRNNSTSFSCEFIFNGRRFRPIYYLLFVSFSFFITGCGAMSNGRGWGQDAIWPIDVERIKRAVHDALFDWQTLVPAAGALVFAVDDWDHKASDWAIKHNPVFGSV